MKAESGEILPYGSLVFRCLDVDCKDSVVYRMVSPQGRSAVPFNEKRVCVETRVLGYQPAIDTLDAGENGAFFLTADAVIMKNVVVTGQALPISSDRSLYNVRVIGREEMDDRAAQNLRDAMSGELNIRIDQDNILGSSLRIGGMSGQQVKILVDGTPVVGRVGDNIDLTQLPVTELERVEVVEGPLSVIYGTDALGGVVNLITKNPTGDSYRTEATLYHESVGSWNADLSVSGLIGSTAAKLSGGRHYFAGFSEVDTGRAKRWKPREQTFLNLELKQYIGSFSIGYDGRLFDEYILNRGTPRPPYGETAFDDTYSTTRLTNRVTATLPFSDGGIEGMGSYSTYSRTTNTFLKNLVTLESKSDPAEQDTSSVQAWNTRLVYYTRGTDSTFLVDFQAGFEGNGETIQGDRIEEEEKNVQEYALFATAALRPFDRLTMRPGLRYAYNTRYEAPLIPSLHLLYSASDNLVLRSSWGRGFRSPSLRDLFFLFIDINHNIRGNSDLRAETSDNFSLSASWHQEQVTSAYEAEVQLFYNDVKDLIALVNVENDLYSYVNIGDFRSTGVEVTGGYSTSSFSSRAGVAAIGRDDGISGESGLKAFTFSPEATLDLSYKLTDYMKLATFYKFTGPLTSYGIDENENLLERQMDGYHTLDASLGFDVLKDYLHVRVGGKNLFNVINVDYSGAGGTAHAGSSSSLPVAWGRTFFADLTVRFHGTRGE